MKPKTVLGNVLPQFRKDVLQRMSRFDSELYTSINRWGREHARSLRSMRSGLKFFEEDIVDETFPADLKDTFKNFMEEGDTLDELDLKLEDYAGNRAEWDTGADPVDLRAVPSTHTWWSELERNDSVAKVVSIGFQQELRMRPIAARYHYIEMEMLRQLQGHIDTEIRRLERERNSLKESGQNPERVLEIETALSRMNEQAEHCRQQIEHHMDMYHKHSNSHLEQATLAKQETQDLVQMKKDMLAKQGQLRQEKRTAEADGMNKYIEKLDEDITEGKAKTKEHREKFHDEQKKTIENAETKDLYDKFRSEKGDAKTYADNDRRVIQAVLEMDSKKIFDFLAENKATVCFSNAKTLDLLINEQLLVHPRTIKQLYELSADPPRVFTLEEVNACKDDIDKILANSLANRCLFENMTPEEAFRKKTVMDKPEFNEEPHDNFKIAKVAAGVFPADPPRVFTLEEVNACKDDIDKILANSLADRRLFENMTPEEAFRMKTVMDKPEFNEEPHDNFKIAKVAAGVRLAKDLNLHGNIFGTADCVEVIDQYACNKTANLRKQWEAVKDNTGLNPEQRDREFRILREKYRIEDTTWQRTRTTTRAWKTEYTRQLGQVNSISDYESMVTELRSNMQDVANFCRHAPHRFGNTLSATYHLRKHLSEALDQHFGSGAVPKKLTKEQKLEIYFKEVPNVLFAADNRPFSFLQNGLNIRSEWRLSNGYFGAKSQPYFPYTEHFMNTAGSVNTHFKKKPCPFTFLAYLVVPAHFFSDLHIPWTYL